MKQIYSKQELAQFAKKKINLKYDNPQKILNDLKTNIKSSVRILYTKELTNAEIETHALSIANGVFKDLHMITIEIIAHKLSNEIITKSSTEGIDLSEYENYFNTFEKKMVILLLKDRTKQIKKHILLRKNR